MDEREKSIIEARIRKEVAEEDQGQRVLEQIKYEKQIIAAKKIVISKEQNIAALAGSLSGQSNKNIKTGIIYDLFEELSVQKRGDFNFWDNRTWDPDAKSAIEADKTRKEEVLKKYVSVLPETKIKRLIKACISLCEASLLQYEEDKKNASEKEKGDFSSADQRYILEGYNNQFQQIAGCDISVPIPVDCGEDHDA